MKTLKKLLYLLTAKERKRAILLMVMVFVMALTEVLGIVSVMPFMGVLTNPQLIDTNIFLNTAFERSALLGVETKQQFLIVLGSLVFILIVTSLVFKAFTTYVQIRFIHMCEYSISSRLLKGYMHQPYSWFIGHNSSDVCASILSETSTVVGRGVKPMITLIAQSIIAITLITLLLFINPKLTMMVILFFGLFFGLVFFTTRIFLERIGKERLRANQLRFTVVNEGFSAFKELKLGGLEKFYTQKYSEPAKKYVLFSGSSQIIAMLPQYGIQIMAFGSLILAAIYSILKGENFISLIPILTLLAFAGYRLMPALNNMYTSISQIRFVGPALDNLFNEMKNLDKKKLNEYKKLSSISNNITLNDIHYTYPNSSKLTLKNINLSIPINSSTGIVGVTGSGKTTMVDIILGLLEAQQGTLEVDGKIINKDNLRAWQSCIGYVPQEIFLADDTVAANIALGIDSNKTNQENIEKAAKIANLHNFVINELPEKYLTNVGEDGIKLSGGQRQRIGIARALYHNPKVLILDEATNALDTLTERSVMEEVEKLNKNITIIMIAHRISTVKNCDTIFLLEKGKLKAKGTYEELVKTNDYFHKSTTNL